MQKTRQKLLTTAANVTTFGFKVGASKRIKAPLLPICNVQKLMLEE